MGDELINIKNKFQKIVENQIDDFAMHKSYNIFEQAKCINNIDEIISILLNFNKEVPETFYLTKLRMETILAQYFHKDSSLALFNGVSNNNIEKIKHTLNDKQNIRKIQFPDHCTGIFFLKIKKKRFFRCSSAFTSSFIQKIKRRNTIT